MVVWLRREKDAVGLPDGVIRRASLVDICALDTAFQAVENVRVGVLADAQQQAQVIVQAATKEGETIRLQAEEEAQMLFEQARAEGFAAGAEQWNSDVLRSARGSHEQMRQQRERMARIVIAAVEKVVPLQDPQGIYRQVLKMLSKSVQAVRYVTVRVCPQELAHAQLTLRELADGSPLAKLIEVVADERLARGACLVESDQGIVDLSLESQLNALRAAILVAVGDPQGASSESTDA